VLQRVAGSVCSCSVVAVGCSRLQCVVIESELMKELRMD